MYVITEEDGKYYATLQQYLPLAVLKLCFQDDTVKSISTLQQYLPLAVLKLSNAPKYIVLKVSMLQQYLPLAVLKQPMHLHPYLRKMHLVATVLTACGIETLQIHRGQI